jgi:predicted nucleic acid-binding protein
MQDLNIHEIISFDDDFDKVDGIIRVKWKQTNYIDKI